LFSKFKQQEQILFLDPDLKLSIDPKKRYFILLSPSLYWVKKVTLPLKYTHEVKKIAPTLFEETLPEGNYNFYVHKELDNSYLVFAYEDKALLALLTQKGLSISQVKGFSFAQFAIKKDEKALKINEQNVVSFKDDILVLLPLDWFSQTKDINLYEFAKPKQTIKLEQFSHIVDKSTLYKIVALLTLFLMVLIAQYLYYAKHKESLALQKEQLFQKYKLKPTLMQNKAILAQYKKRDQQAQKLRTYINYFLKANFKKKEKIVSFSYDGSLLKVVLEGVTQSSLKRVLSKFYKEKIKFTTKQTGNKLTVEVKI